jgi:hypothetical protein
VGRAAYPGDPAGRCVRRFHVVQDSRAKSRGVCKNSNVTRSPRVIATVIVAVLVKLSVGVGAFWNGCELMSLGELQLAIRTINKMQKTLSFFISYNIITTALIQRRLLLGYLASLTAGVTGAGADVDSAWEHRKLEARKMLVNRARRL